MAVGRQSLTAVFLHTRILCCCFQVERPSAARCALHRTFRQPVVAQNEDILTTHPSSDRQTGSKLPNSNDLPRFTVKLPLLSVQNYGKLCQRPGSARKVDAAQQANSAHSGARPLPWRRSPPVCGRHQEFPAARQQMPESSRNTAEPASRRPPALWVEGSNNHITSEEIA